MTEHVPAPAARLTPRLACPASPPAGSDQAPELGFDSFVLIPSARLLTCDGVPVEIGGRGFDLLLALVQQPGRVLSKRELLQTVWPDVVVEEVALRFQMTRLRKLLNDGPGGRRLIATQVGVGYAFVGDVRPTDGGAGVRPPDRPADVALPSRLDRLIGRDHDLRSLVQRMAAVQFLTVVGLPGVGKTSLAIEAAHELAPRFADGAVFIDLAPLATPDGLVPAVATALGLDPSAGDPMTQVLQNLQRRQRLLVFDTGEHLVQALASLAERIAAAAPEVRILTTSREALRARNEHVHRLAPHRLAAEADLADGRTLRAAPAVDLFLHQASTAGGAIECDLEALRTIAGICRRLDGVAMAIEVAAVRAASHGLDATARRLGEGPSLFWPGRRTAPPRQRTLKASLDWSYDLLSPSEGLVFELAARLATPFSLEVALAAGGAERLDPAAIAMALDELTEKSLLLPDEGKYRWPERVQLYARERLRRPANEDAAEAHARSPSASTA